jgi:RNA polymerase sigma-70 factor (ECF subfamily)
MLIDARGGSDAAMNALFEACGPRLLSLIRLRMGSSLRAQMESGDLLNATLMRAFQSFDDSKASSHPSLMAWLSRIAENVIRDQVDYQQAQRRDRRKEAALSGELQALQSRLRSQTGQLLADERQEELEAAIEALPHEQREVVILRQLEELPYAEIGARLGKSADSCRMMLARAMATLTLSMRPDQR